MKKFRFTYTMTCDLTETEIWPDKDAPSNPTADDVEALIKKEGGWVKVIDTWGFDFEGGEGHVEEIKEVTP